MLGWTKGDIVRLLWFRCEESFRVSATRVNGQHAGYADLTSVVLFRMDGHWPFSDVCEQECKQLKNIIELREKLQSHEKNNLDLNYTIILLLFS
ncbi:hypothetical protein TNCV_4112631 [Trichonephila clavipes]|nr:hypothetical protein TNCV_4112631 [Trichonephila clavipes]